MSRVGAKLAPNGTNLGLFQDQFSVHFGSPSQNELKTDLKKPQIRLILGKSNLICVKLLHPCPSICLCNKVVIQVDRAIFLSTTLHLPIVLVSRQ